MSHKWHKPLTLGVSALVVFGMVGITAGAVSAAHSASHSAAPSGSFVFSDYQFPSALNPQQDTSAVGQGNYNLIMPQGAVPFVLPNGKVLPGFLTGTPTHSKNGLTYTMFLRKGLKWSNGQSITNKDVLFDWNESSNPNSGPACASTCDNIKSIQLKGNYEVIWHMKHVYAAAWPNAWPGVLPHTWSRLGTKSQLAACLKSEAGCDGVANKIAADPTFNYFDKSFVTAGPYQVSSFTNNNSITYSANPNYTSAAPGGKPKIKNVTFLFYTSIPAMIAGADRHDTDVTQDYTLKSLPLLKGHFTTLLGAGINPEVLIFNTYNKKTNIDQGPSGVSNPATSTAFRQALYLSFDKPGLMANAYGLTMKQAQTNVSYDAPMVASKASKALYYDRSITGVWDPIKHKYVVPNTAQAIKDAKTLLKKAKLQGATIYLTTTAGNPTRAAEQQYLQHDWAQIGVKTVIENVPASAYFADWQHQGTLAHGHFQAAIFALGGVTPDPDSWKDYFLGSHCSQTDPNHGPLSLNYGCFHNAQVDQGMNKGGATFSPSGRQKAYNEFQQAVVQNAYWSIIAPRPEIWTTDGRVKGIQMDSYSASVTWNSYNWKVM